MKRFKKFGTALLSCMMLTTSFATVSNMTMITAEAHPGRTDAQGGHHDYKNKSGFEWKYVRSDADSDTGTVRR